MYADSGPDPLPDDQVTQRWSRCSRCSPTRPRVQGAVVAGEDRECRSMNSPGRWASPAPSVSQHLAKLRMARLVRTRLEYDLYRLENERAPSTPFSTPSTLVGIPPPPPCCRRTAVGVAKASATRMSGKANLTVSTTTPQFAPQVRGPNLRAVVRQVVASSGGGRLRAGVCTSGAIGGGMRPVAPVQPARAQVRNRNVTKAKTSRTMS